MTDDDTTRKIDNDVLTGLMPNVFGARKRPGQGTGSAPERAPAFREPSSMLGSGEFDEVPSLAPSPLDSVPPEKREQYVDFRIISISSFSPHDIHVNPLSSGMHYDVPLMVIPFLRRGDKVGAEAAISADPFFNTVHPSVSRQEMDAILDALQSDEGKKKIHEFVLSHHDLFSEDPVTYDREKGILTIKIPGTQEDDLTQSAGGISFNYAGVGRHVAISVARLVEFGTSNEDMERSISDGLSQDGVTAITGRQVLEILMASPTGQQVIKEQEEFISKPIVIQEENGDFSVKPAGHYSSIQFNSNYVSLLAAGNRDEVLEKVESRVLFGEDAILSTFEQSDVGREAIAVEQAKLQKLQDDPTVRVGPHSQPDAVPKPQELAKYLIIIIKDDDGFFDGILVRLNGGSEIQFNFPTLLELVRNKFIHGFYIPAESPLIGKYSEAVIREVEEILGLSTANPEFLDQKRILFDQLARSSVGMWVATGESFDGVIDIKLSGQYNPLILDDKSRATTRLIADGKIEEAVAHAVARGAGAEKDVRAAIDFFQASPDGIAEIAKVRAQMDQERGIVVLGPTPLYSSQEVKAALAASGITLGENFALGGAMDAGPAGVRKRTILFNPHQTIPGEITIDISSISEANLSTTVQDALRNYVAADPRVSGKPELVDAVMKRLEDCGAVKTIIAIVGCVSGINRAVPSDGKTLIRPSGGTISYGVIAAKPKGTVQNGG